MEEAPNFLKVLQGLLDDHLGKKEFIKNFKAVIDRQKTFEKEKGDELATVYKTLQTFALKLKEDNGTDVTGLKDEVRTLVTEQLSAIKVQLTAKIQEVDDKLATVTNGLDADEDVIVERVLARIPPPPQISIEDVRNGFEVFQGQDRLKPTALDGWEQVEARLKALEERKIGTVGWGAHPLAIAQSGTVKAKVARHINFTGATVTQNADGSTTVAVTGGSGGTGYQAPLSGGLTGTNTWTTAPSLIVVDQGRPMQKVNTDGTVNWTGTTTTVLTVTPTFDVYAAG